jgi:hypothetical protein
VKTRHGSQQGRFAGSGRTEQSQTPGQWGVGQDEAKVTQTEIDVEAHRL